MRFLAVSYLSLLLLVGCGDNPDLDTTSDEINGNPLHVSPLAKQRIAGDNNMITRPEHTGRLLSVYSFKKHESSPDKNDNKSETFSAACGLSITKDYCDGKFDFVADSCFEPVTYTEYSWFIQKEGITSLIPIGNTINQRAIEFSATVATAGRYRLVVQILFYDYATDSMRNITINSDYVTVVREPTSPYPGAKPLLRYSNGVIHFYTTNWCLLGSAGSGYHFESIQGHLYTSALPSTVPLYRYYNDTLKVHFYTTDWGELGSGRGGWRYVSIEGYVYNSLMPNTTALYRFYKNVTIDHFYTADLTEALSVAKYGFDFERIQCYVLK
jgi:hypothetical protein